MSGALLLPFIPIPFMEIPTAILALTMLGAEVVKGVGILANDRNRTQVEHVLRMESGLEIGMRKNRKGELELVVDQNELRTKEGIELKEFEEKFRQKYAYVDLVKKLEADGYTLVEENEEADNTIRLVVRRWR